jgi:ABC-type amino acid transport substrate-binding protein
VNRRSLALSLVVAFALVGPARAGPKGEVVVGFRADAPPFSAAEGEGFTGYLAALCEEGVARAGYAVAERRPLTALDRLDTEAGGGTSVDLVCDPTTLTQERARRFDFSPILFIANSTFLLRQQLHFLTEAEVDAAEDCRTRRDVEPGLALVAVGMVGNTTSRAAFDLAISTGALAETPEFGFCVVAFSSHADGLAEACEGFVSVYFGDLDIVRAQLEGVKSCAAVPHRSFLAYEPYALSITSSNPDFRRSFVSAVLGMFADGTTREMYREAFGNSPMSPSLEMLFRINAVPLGISDQE